MVWLEYHGLWRSWVLVYTRLAVIGEQNVGLRAPGSANLMCRDALGRTLRGFLVRVIRCHLFSGPGRALPVRIHKSCGS